MKLKDKVVLVTGSSRGIGRSIAIALAKEGAKVVVNYLSSREKAEEVVGEISNLGSEAISIQADVSVEEDVKRLFAETSFVFGGIDIVISNAGSVYPKPFTEQTVEDWNKNFLVNTISHMLIAKYAALHMLPKRKGKIIFTSSMRGLFEFGRPGIMDYCMSKSAVISLTKNLAKELAPDIQVNSVAPGFTETDLASKWDIQTREAAVKDVYLKRIMTPDEVAQAYLYLSTEAANGITGQVIVVDGGYSLK